MSWPAIKLGFDQEGFRKYVRDLPVSKWHPSMVVWHNTAAPSLAQWMKSAAQDKVAGFIPGITRIRNLEAFFRINNGWSGCPHLFVANDLIWVMNPLTAPGVHSPSWNSISFGIEMIGDFDKEDDDSGEGLKVKNNAIFATAILCETFGIDPRLKIMLHKQDPKTTHDCPGKNIARDKDAMMQAVQDLMSGGEHSSEQVAKIIAGDMSKPEQTAIQGKTIVADLTLRTGPGVNNEARGSLPNNTTLTILDQAKNGTSTWLRVKTPAGYIGWVAGKFVELNNGEKL